MNPALVRLFAASLGRRRLATALALFAIALGVALGLAVQLIHEAALDEFGRGMRELAGEADLQVRSGRVGFDEQLYLTLALRPEIAEASPVLELDARLPGRAGTLRILGIDLFRVAHVQPALMPVADDRDARFAGLQPDTIFLSAAAQDKAMGKGRGVLRVQSGVKVVAFRVAGTVPGAGVGQALGVMDIAAAQEAFGQVGRLTRIDLKLAPGVSREQAVTRLSPLLPAGISLSQPEASGTEAAALSRAYRVNLTMLAAIALLTGGFLVFSTQWLSVVRRRREFALFRALGMNRGTLLRGLLLEGAITGLAGGLAGIALGHLFAALAFRLIGGDLGAGYFEGLRPSLQFSPGVIGFYTALGVAAGIAGAWLPAHDATLMGPASGLKAGAAEAAVLGGMKESRGRGALACFGLGLFACLLPPFGGIPVGGYVAVALALACAVMVLPWVTRFSMQVLNVGRGVVWRLAHARLAAAPGQAVVAGAGVVASVALAVSMAIMVSSFRVSVDDWLGTVLPADLYLRASSAGASGFFDADALKLVENTPGVAFIDTVRATEVRLIDGRPPVTLIAREVSRGWGLPLVSGSLSAHQRDDSTGLPPAWLSEAAADMLQLAPGSTLSLPIAGRMNLFRVAGVWRDYARQNGAVVIGRDVYRQLSGDLKVNDVAIRVVAGTSVDEVALALRGVFSDDLVDIAMPGEIRKLSLEIFDRTFLVTYLMEAVAIMIGLFGIASTFAALSTARKGEFGMLRHLGMTRAEIGRLIALEGGLTAAVGVGVGVVAGGGIAWILIEVVNRQSFHWSMDIHVPYAGLAAFSLGLVVLAAMVARVAGYRAMRQSAVLAVREDW
ncbi:MAG: ABC transporter permease [Azoarcus sp.]|nr:ABC transporter permease [Azoarcus sp.]